MHGFDAIAAFQEGFRAKPAPQFLYNIAQSYRLSKRPDRAVLFYRKYLALEPEAANRAEVETQIKTLDEIVRQQQSRASRQPQQPLPPASEPRPDLVATTPAAAKPTPLYKKGWFWGVMATTVAVVAVGVTLGVVYGTQGSSAQTLPAARF